jgi:hypothetical protein
MFFRVASIFLATADHGDDFANNNEEVAAVNVKRAIR